MLDRLFPPHLAQSDYAAAYRSIMRALSLPSEQPALDDLLESFPLAPQEVLLSSLGGPIANHDFIAAATGCTMLVAYIGAAKPLGNIGGLQESIPALTVGRVLGARHVAPPLAMSRSTLCSRVAFI